MATIALSNLSKRFGGFAALRNLDLTVNDSEFIALLGPSGCGKSTTMNLIAGMLSPSEGKILFGERDVTRVEMGRRGVGFVFQNYAIFTHMTVRENLAFGLRMQRVPAAERQRRVGAMAELLQLGPLLDRPTSALSVNILQRLAIGRSAIVEPAIFLLDEPLSNVDAAFRAVMRTELKSLQRQFKQTMVYVTHDQLEAMTMADRIAVMDGGVLQQVGGPLQVYNEPRNVFVARFIGSPGMNVLSGLLAQCGADQGVALGDIGWLPLGSARLSATAKRASAAQVMLGVRPEDVAIDASGTGDLKMRVVFVERVGARAIVHLEAGPHAMKMIAGEGPLPSVDEMVSLKLNPDRLRLFDGATGRALDLE
jgi:multiple sugar transport system ATP-binding protein